MQSTWQAGSVECPQRNYEVLRSSHLPGTLGYERVPDRTLTSLISVVRDAHASAIQCQTVDRVKQHVRILGSIEGGLTVLVGLAPLIQVTA
jgi:hypothetical protein